MSIYSSSSSSEAACLGLRSPPAPAGAAGRALSFCWARRRGAIVRVGCRVDWCFQSECRLLARDRKARFSSSFTSTLLSSTPSTTKTSPQSCKMADDLDTAQLNKVGDVLLFCAGLLPLTWLHAVHPCVPTLLDLTEPGHQRRVQGKQGAVFHSIPFSQHQLINAISSLCVRLTLLHQTRLLLVRMLLLAHRSGRRTRLSSTTSSSPMRWTGPHWHANGCLIRRRKQFLSYFRYSSSSLSAFPARRSTLLWESKVKQLNLPSISPSTALQIKTTPSTVLS